MSILRLMLQTPIADHHSSRDKAFDREDGSQLLALRIRSQPLLQESRASVLPMTTILVLVPLRSNLEWMSILRLTLARNNAIVIRGVHDVATHTTAETRKLEGKLDALVNLVTQLAANQKLASVTRVCGIRSTTDHHTSICPSSQQSGQFSARNDVIIIRGVHDAAIDTSVETRKLEGNLDTVVNLVTQLAANQMPACVARVYGICSSDDHHTSVCPSSQQSGVDRHLEAYAANTYSRPPQQQRQGT
ncbi:hypothetical protein Fmac_032795 [Flemingia macrophylla]|uniref:Uncharacterized protein n=1 Tax=Flemingia macrophylla TaxID=520843 RepID=A0ABD1L5Y8_9FABA